MKVSCRGTILATLLMAQGVNASFFRDVVGEKPTRENMIENALLEKAMPLKEYRAKLRANGMDIADSAHRKLNNGNNNNGNNGNKNNGNNGDDDAGDDWYSNGNGDDWYRYGGGNENNYGNDGNNYSGNNNAANNAYGNYNNNNNNGYDYDNNDDYYMVYGNYFNSYALKYAQCQPVQRFSPEAVQAGEASPMLVDDIVILRLCPTKSCSKNRKYGCGSTFAEYAVGLTDYVEIMLYYRQDRMNQMCDWCNQCYNQNRKLNNYNNGDDDNADDGYSGYNRYNTDTDCSDYKSYCYDSDTGYSKCEAYSANDDIKTSNYLNCVEVKDSNNYNYYIRPRCDGQNQLIHMGVYNDNFCSNYAGDEVSIDDFNLGLQNTNFDEFYDDVNCLDCTKGVSLKQFHWIVSPERTITNPFLFSSTFNSNHLRTSLRPTACATVCTLAEPHVPSASMTTTLLMELLQTVKLVSTSRV